MAGNSEKNRENAEKQKAKAKKRLKEATDSATGKGPKPIFGTEEWAKKRGLEK